MEQSSASYLSAANPELPSQDPLRVLFAGESQTVPLHKLGPKIYDYYLFHYIEQGAGEFRTEDARFLLQAGSGFLIQQGQLVSYASDTDHPWRYRWIAFSGSGASQLVKEVGFSEQNLVLHAQNNNIFSTSLEAILNLFRAHQEGAHLAALGHLYQLMSEAKRSLLSGSNTTPGQSRIQQVVKQMIQYMTSQYTYPVSIEEMCSGLGYNRAYLSRVFKQGTGMSPVTYLLKLRIDKARYLLRDRPDLSIEQIAASVGITDPLYFSRQFKRFCGKSPSLYRQSVTGHHSSEGLS